MKRILTFFTLIVVVGLLSFVAYDQVQKQTQTPIPIVTSENVWQEKPKGIAKAMTYLSELRGNPLDDNKVDMKDVLKARKHADVQAALKSSSDIDIEWEELGPNNVGGRVRALVIDRDNHNKLITGGVSGGIFISTDAGNNWEQIQNSIDVGCVSVTAIDQAADGTLYAGTGEYFGGSGFYDGSGGSQFPGSGVYKSTDGGYTWSLLPSTAPTNTNSPWWSGVTRVFTHKIDPNVIYVGTGGAFFMSVDGGTTWISPEGVPANASPVHDLQVASNGTVHVSAGSAYYRATDGFTFERLDSNNPGSFPTKGARKILVVAPSDPDVIYGLTIQSNCLDRIFRSTNGGTDWDVIGVGTTDYFDPVDGGGYCQGWYDLTIGVDSQDPNRIYVGGISLWSGRDQGGVFAWDQVDIPGGASNPSLPNYVHADKHHVLFHPTNNNIMYVCTDGGIFKSTNATADFPSFEPKNKGLNVTQFYSVAADHLGRVMGGTQDNSTPYIPYDINSPQTADVLFGGDGGYVEMSNINSNAFIVESQFGNMARSSNGGEGFSGFFDCNIDEFPQNDDGGCGGDGEMDGGAPFITAFHMWEDTDLYYFMQGLSLAPGQDELPVTYSGQNFVITRNIGDVTSEDAVNVYTEPTLYIGWDGATNTLMEDGKIKRTRFFTGGNDGKLWMTEEVIRFNVTPTWIDLGNAQGSLSAYSTSANGDMVYAGTAGGRLLRVTGLNSGNYSATQVNNTPFSGRFVTGISVDQTNPNNMVVVCGNYGFNSYVFQCTNAMSSSPTFTDITNNLPAMPVYDVVINSDNPTQIIAGTEMGVWACETNNFFTWTEQNAGLGRFPVHRLRQERMAREDPQFYSFCKVLYVGSHGRGLFRSTSLASTFCPESVIGLPEFSVSTDDIDVETGFTVYPNPTSDVARIDLNFDESTSINLNVYDLQGRLVQEITNASNLIGAHTFEVDVHDLPAGNYIVSLATDEQQLSRKLIVTK